MRCIALLAALFISVSELVAQESQPFVSASAGPALLMLQTVEDGETRSKWDFAPATQFRGSLDKRIGENTNVGLSFGYAPLTLKYSRIGTGHDPTGICPSTCEANAQFYSFAGSLRVTSGVGLHHVVEGNFGINVYRDFRERESDDALHAVSSDRDIGFMVGYGLGWSSSERVAVSLVGDVGFSIHHRSGAAANLTSLNPLLMVRIVFRAGIGG